MTKTDQELVIKAIDRWEKIATDVFSENSATVFGPWWQERAGEMILSTTDTKYTDHRIIIKSFIYGSNKGTYHDRAVCKFILPDKIERLLYSDGNIKRRLLVRIIAETAKKVVRNRVG